MVERVPMNSTTRMRKLGRQLLKKSLRPKLWQILEEKLKTKRRLKWPLEFTLR